MGSWYLATTTAQDRRFKPEEYDWGDNLEKYELSNSLESVTTNPYTGTSEVSLVDPKYFQGPGRINPYNNVPVPLHTLEQRAKRLGKGRPLLLGSHHIRTKALESSATEEFSDTSANESASNSHDVPSSCPRGKDKRSRPYRHKSDSGPVPSVMDDFNGMAMVKKRETKRGAYGHKQPPLKTVSIIDTLSKLAEDVSQFKDPPLPRQNTGRRQQKPESSEIENVLPPLVSPDFKQYTEQIYDAMTKKSILASSDPNNKKWVINAPEKIRGVKTSTPQKPDGTPRRLDPVNHFRKHRPRARERGRTPDWIRKIFEIAKKGELQPMKDAISGMEETLVRNLSDHSGNNLLHVMAVYGHLTLLAWLLTTQPILLDGLQDENKFGLTPLVCAVKYGRLNLVQWLVENTPVKDKVRCKEGERSLLHIAAKYTQEEVLSWLVDYMMTHEISLDNKDHMGNTALHLVARSGDSRICSILLQKGADVTLKNDLGQNASEICLLRGHLACAEYLCVHEAGLALASDLTSREAELEASNADNDEIRIHFKELMSVARRLLRERDEAVRDLSKLHEHMVETHDNIIMSLQVLAEENSSLRDRVNGVRGSQHPREQVENVIGHVTSLHERWQNAQKTWFGSSLVNMKHRMLLVEDGWKKLKHRNHRTVASTHHPLDMFRAKLCTVRESSSDCRFRDLPSLYSSEESLGSLFPFSDEEEVNLTSNRSTQPLLEGGMSVAQPKDAVLSRASHARIRSDLKHQASEDHEHHEGLQQSSILPNGAQSKVCWNDISPRANPNILSDISPRDRLPKEEISARLKELALTSESGSCSVLEVIEPSSDGSDVPMEGDGEAIQLPKASHRAPKEPKISLATRTKRFVSRNDDERHVGSDNPDTITSSESGVDAFQSNESKPMTFTNGTESDDQNHFLGSETSTVAAGVNVSSTSQRSFPANEEIDAANGTVKRKGFLQKLIKPSKWSSTGRRKLKAPPKPDIHGSPDVLPNQPSEIPPTESFSSLPEYEHQQNPSGSDPSIQEFQNSSDDSFVVKASMHSKSVESLSAHLSEEESHISQTNQLSDAQPVPHTNPPKFSPIPTPTSVRKDAPPPIPTRISTIGSMSTLMEQRSIREPFEVSPEDQNMGNLRPLKKLLVSGVRSLPVSEDSGIVVRPSSSASKSESVSRPESSSSHFPTYKSEGSLRKSTLSLTQEILTTPDSSTAGRMSPAPSEVSKTESALSPPSHASDLSKSESTRQSTIGKENIENNVGKDSNSLAEQSNCTVLSQEKDQNRIPCILEVSTEPKNNSPNIKECTNEEESNEKLKPWYELSDEESDILLPDSLTTKSVPRNSSSEDET